MRKTGTLMLSLLLLASCAAPGDKTYKMPNSTMEPAITDGTLVGAKPVKPGDYRPALGDVVVIRPPASWGLTGPDDLIIRRVVGVAGQTVECCEGPHGQIKINGALVDEPYLSPNGGTASFPAVTVPAGQIYVMEDNRGSGVDSAQRGPLSADTVIGVVRLI